MKITKQYLKQVIKEEMTKIYENSSNQTHYNNIKSYINNLRNIILTKQKYNDPKNVNQKEKLFQLRQNMRPLLTDMIDSVEVLTQQPNLSDFQDELNFLLSIKDKNTNIIETNDFLSKIISAAAAVGVNLN